MACREAHRGQCDDATSEDDGHAPQLEVACVPFFLFSMYHRFPFSPAKKNKKAHPRYQLWLKIVSVRA